MVNGSETASLWVSAVAALISAAGAVVSIIFSWKTHKNAVIQTETAKNAIDAATAANSLANMRRSYELATSLSKFYVDEILPSVTFIFLIFDEEKQASLIAPLLFVDNLKFSDNERIRLFPESKYPNVLVEMMNVPADKVRQNLVFVPKLAGEYQMQLEICKKAISEHPQLSDFVANRFYNDAIMNTLNQLEYMCMSFNRGVADEQVAYQSLHQTFLSTIGLLYHYIAHQNKNGSDKFFTNIMDIYNIWKKRQLIASGKEKAEMDQFSEILEAQSTFCPPTLRY